MVRNSHVIHIKGIVRAIFKRLPEPSNRFLIMICNQSVVSQSAFVVTGTLGYIHLGPPRGRTPKSKNKDRSDSRSEHCAALWLGYGISSQDAQQCAAAVSDVPHFHHIQVCGHDADEKPPDKQLDGPVIDRIGEPAVPLGEDP